MEPSWAVLEASWTVFRTSWAVLGPSWAVLGPSGAILSRLGAIAGPCRAVLQPRQPQESLMLRKTVFCNEFQRFYDAIMGRLGQQAPWTTTTTRGARAKALAQKQRTLPCLWQTPVLVPSYQPSIQLQFPESVADMVWLRLQCLVGSYNPPPGC